MASAFDRSGKGKERGELKKGKGNTRVQRRRQEGAHGDVNLNLYLGLRRSHSLSTEGER
jgi:hypothetical protein